MKLDDHQVDAFLIAAATGNTQVSDDEYQQIFEGQGKREYIINYLAGLADEGMDLARYCYLAVGAADGSEPAEVLKRTPVNVAAMIEISDAGAQMARENAARLPDGKQLNVMQGDVMDRIADVGNWIKQEHPDVSGVILSLQAVLHELPNRCRSFDFDEFLAKAFSPFENCVFLAGEPVQPSNWPQRVEISIENVSSEKLAKAAEYVSNHLRFDDVRITAMHGGWVQMESTLAVEVLHKLVRSRTQAEFVYEIGERLTQFSSGEIMAAIGKHLQSDSVQYKERTSDGFLKAYREAGVRVRDTAATPLDPPLTHARFLTLFDDRFNSKLVTTSAPPAAANPPAATPEAGPETKTETGWTLRGTNPEPGKEKHISFRLAPGQFAAHNGELTLGRKPEAAALVIDNTTISKAHAVLAHRDGMLTIRDNHSSNGTTRNSAPLEPGEAVPLNAGDHLRLGEVTLRLYRE